MNDQDFIHTIDLTWWFLRAFIEPLGLYVGVPLAAYLVVAFFWTWIERGVVRIRLRRDQLSTKEVI